jgi:hypothetical protein
VPPPIKRQRHIHHRKSGADDQNRQMGRKIFQRVFCPRRDGRYPIQSRFCIIGRSQDCQVGNDRAAGLEPENNFVTNLHKIDATIAHGPQSR